MAKLLKQGVFHLLVRCQVPQYTVFRVLPQ